MSDAQVDRLRAFLRAEKAAQMSEGKSWELPILIGQKWVKDSNFTCHYCSTEHKGKYNLSRHLWSMHREQLMKDTGMDEADLSEFFGANIRTQNDTDECDRCKKTFNRRYLRSGHLARCKGKPKPK